MRETHRSRRRSIVPTQRPAAGGEGEVAPPEAPSLAELRRRATHRLREIAARLDEVTQEHARAAAECARLGAANGAVTHGELPSTPPPEIHDRPVEPSRPPDAVLPDAAAGREEEPAADDRLADLEALLARERASKAALERRLSALQSDLERERSAQRVVAEERDRLKAGLRHAEGRLAAQSQRAAALETRAQQLEGELEAAMQPPESSDGRIDSWPQRVLQLQLDLRGALEDKAQACDKLESLLRFLDELNEVLAAPGVGAG